jgi:hypothetical protein
MAPIVVKNTKGNVRVSRIGATAPFLGLVIVCAVVPAVIFWLAFDDVRLVRTSAVIGLSIAFTSFSLLLCQQLRLPLDRLPTRD